MNFATKRQYDSDVNINEVILRILNITASLYSHINNFPII